MTTKSFKIHKRKRFKIHLITKMSDITRRFEVNYRPLHLSLENEIKMTSKRRDRVTTKKSIRNLFPLKTNHDI